MARRRKKKSDWKSTVRRDVLLSSRRANARRSTLDDWRAYRPGFSTGRTPTSSWVRRTPSKQPLRIETIQFLGNFSDNPLFNPVITGRPISRSIKEIRRAFLCGKRQVRKEVLFANKIAGRNRRNSPGRGGTYKRTPESRITCT